MKKSNEVTIIIPVYADWKSLNDCIESLTKYVNGKHKVILINDCGPEADILEKKIKTTIADLKNFEYYRNPKNLGFVKTCNRAVMELDKTDNDVLLLNSDTKTTPNFLEEMTEVLNSASGIGVATPRTNNATLATIPVTAAKYRGISPKKSYKLFLKIKDKLPRYNEVPTAHGFCMLIKRPLIKKYGLFDEVFGKGYGEENDFCMRIKSQGYKSVLCNRAFVFHLEARSFSLEAKAPMLEKNLQILYERWPDYRPAVREYMKNAILQEAQLLPKSYKLLLAKKGGLKPLVKKLARR